jgi:flagellar protein FlaG
MDVNILGSESRSFGSTPVAPAMVRQDKQKTSVTPVASSADTEGGKALSQQKGRLSREQAIQYVQEIQARFDKMGTNLQFSIDNSSEDVVIKITAKDSGELIRQFPSEAILQLRNQLNDLVGTLFDGKA